MSGRSLMFGHPCRDRLPIASESSSLFIWAVKSVSPNIPQVWCFSSFFSCVVNDSENTSMSMVYWGECYPENWWHLLPVTHQRVWSTDLLLNRNAGDSRAHAAMTMRWFFFSVWLLVVTSTEAIRNSTILCSIHTTRTHVPNWVLSFDLMQPKPAIIVVVDVVRCFSSL